MMRLLKLSVLLAGITWIIFVAVSGVEVRKCACAPLPTNSGSHLIM
ncbi:hypothetical protein M5X11_12880 [Paenibacillus alginolyticus]|nr:hypothetical protein [Paenibacillus alginolyticus]MCY9665849.1 hypothetical protein [Paenibacillus alginolyticus]